MVIPAGNVKKRVFVQKDPLTNKVITSTNLLDQENGYSITFNFDENSASSKINPNIFKTNPVPISSSPKWLFLGYRCQNGPCRINGRFFSFVLNEE